MITGKKPPPDRWVNCPKYSRNVICDLFIAGKTFLSNSYKVPSGKRFHPSQISNIQSAFKKPISAIISLSNSVNYYKIMDLPDKKIKFHHIMCTGQGAPNKEQLDQFINICDDEFVRFPNSLIYVHCTHGFNRTGFMISSYLYTKKGYPIRACVNLFAKARPPGIYKQDYVDELVKLHSSETGLDELKEQEIAIKAGERPEWKDHDETHEQESGEDNFAEYDDEARFMFESDRIVHCDSQTEYNVRKRIKKILCCDRNVFPGVQPISCCANNLCFFSSFEYYVSYKADGVRYLMYIRTRDEIFFIDRNNNVFQVYGIQFPYTFRRRKLELGCFPDPDPGMIGHLFDEEVYDGKSHCHLMDTLVDGEIVCDVERKTKTYKFLMFDLIQINGNSINIYDFDKRQQCMKHYVFNGYWETFKNGNEDRSFLLIRPKLFVKFQDIHEIDELVKSLKHPTDGYIFQPVNFPYTWGRSPYVLKWKPAHLNSVDFRISIVSKREKGCLERKEANLLLMDNSVYDTIPYRDGFKDLNDAIVECTLVENGWKILRRRTDKNFPNARSTVDGVMQSIKSPVTLKDIINESKKRLIGSHPTVGT